VELRILGPLEVATAEGPIRLGSRRERAVLGALVLGGGDVVSADRLVEALWGEQPPRSAAKTLQNYVLKLRKALGPGVIETRTPGYRLVVEAVAVDVRRFDELVRRALDERASGRPHEAAATLREAVGLWRGDPLEELDGWATADAEARRLSELHRVAAEELVDAEIACGRAAPMVAELETMVAAEPLRERRWTMLMLALYRCGRQADALRTYQRARTLLGDELGIEPGPALRDLERAIASQDPSLDLADITEQDAADGDDEEACPPYQGLAPFDTEDQERFFGRTALVADLVAGLGQDRFVAVVGPSGSGKSSVVRAGVVAALRNGALQGSTRWPTMVMTPGAHPLLELAVGLAPLLERTTSEVLDCIEGDARGFALLAAERVPAETQLVVVVDQAEELFTQVHDVDERQRFVTSLAHALDEVDSPVRVLVALRADFYGHAAAHPELAAWLDRGSTLLCPMGRDELREAIEEPAAVAGLAVEPGLVELVVRDLGDQPGALPLLSHALMETWKRRTRHTLTVAGYRAAGGVQGAISQTAETLHRGLDPSAQAWARILFLRLTELGEGTPDTSRRVARTELAAPSDGTDAAHVIERLAEARLITIDEDTVQVAHEALIQEWPRLRGWLDEDRDSRRIHRHLTRAAQGWEALGREPTELYQGPRLATAAEWVARTGTQNGLNALETEFLDASAAREDAAEQMAEEQARARDRSNRRLRALLVAAVVALGVALVAGAVAIVQRGRADHEAATSRARSLDATADRLVAQSQSLQGENRYLGTLLALEADRIRDTPQSRGAIFSALLEEPRLVRTIPTSTSEAVAPLPDGTALVLNGGRIGRWDLRQDRRLAQLPGAPATAMAVGPRGVVAVGRSDGTIALVDASGAPHGPVIHTSFANTPLPGPHQLAFSPDGRRLAAAFGVFGDPSSSPETDEAIVYDTRTGRPLGAHFGGHTQSVTAVAFSADGRVLLTGGNDALVVLHDVGSGTPVAPPIHVNGPVSSASFDPTHDRIAVGTNLPGATVMSLDGTHRTVLGTGSEADIGWNREGTRLAVGGNSSVQVFDAATLRPVDPPIAAQSGTASPRFLGDGRILVAGREGPATLWDLNGQSVLARQVPNAPAYVFPMAGGKVIAVPDLRDSVTLIDARTLEPLGPPLTPGAAPGAQVTVAWPTTFAASYDHGDRIAVINRAGRLQLYAVPSRRPIGAPFDLGFPTVYAIFSRDMNTVAVGGQGGQVALVDLRTRHVRVLRSRMTNYVDALAYTTNGGLMAADAGHAVLFRHLERATPSVDDLSRFVAWAAGPAGADVSPDGRTIAMASAGSVTFVDVATERAIGVPFRVSSSPIVWLAYSRDGRMIVTSDLGSGARLVDVATHQVVGPELRLDPYTGPVFSRDSRTLGTSTPAGGALLSVDPAVWRREACRLAGRNLTADEWAKYLPGEGPRHRTCPQYS
jgi:DNA-binding SARP family transcriptional activator/WD40 repeat protein